MNESIDTIYALASGGGRSGVAVIRISGEYALQALPHFAFHKSPKARYAHFHNFVLEGEFIDQGLILFFPGPNSFTGEDIVEFQLHGSSAVVKKILHELAKIPHFRPARAGEFAKRAFLNGKIDLTAAEGIADLIEAETEMQRRQAAQIMQGNAARFYEGLRQSILEPLSLLEAYIDFPEEDIPEAVLAEIGNNISQLYHKIDDYLRQDRYGEKIRNGFSVVLVGAPNAGKSSLLNLLAKRDAAIVSSKAGTTRDLIEVHMDINGIPVILTDTAGLCVSDDEIEMEGVRRAKNKAAEADILLALFDSSKAADAETIALIDSRTIVLNTKIDLGVKKGAINTPSNPLAYIDISAVTALGVDRLLETITAYLQQAVQKNQNAYIVRERHRIHLQAALVQLALYQQEQALELQAERLRLAARELAIITGKIDVEDLLDNIFSKFCIGK